MSEPTATRDRILAAAAQLFATRGYAGTSIADVAEASGLLKGNLAYYFKTKQALLDAVLDARSQALRAELVAPAQPGEDSRASIARLLDQVRSSAEDLARYGCPVGGLATELGKTDDALHANAAALLLGLEAYLREAFERVMPPPEAERLAEQLLARLQGAAVLAQARRDPAVVHRQVDEARAWLETVLPAAKRRR